MMTKSLVFRSTCLLLGLLLACGGAGSSSVTPTATKPSITTQPLDQTVTAGQAATFSVAASGTPPLSYQWKKNGTDISDATSASYTTPATTMADNGATFTVTVSNSLGSVTSSAVTLTVSTTVFPTPTLQVEGNKLLDTMGNHLIIRGVEQDLLWDWSQASWVDNISTTGANAMRVIVNHENMTWQNVDDLFAKISGHGMVFYWSIYTPPSGYGLTDYTDINYWNVPEVKSLYQKYKKWIIIDAGQEYQSTDRTGWRDWAIARIQQLRAWGYDCPFDIITAMYGRDLSAILTYGAAVEEADPLHMTIFGWQAYWYEEGHSDWSGGWTYQGDQGMTLYEGIQKASQQNFPIQIGIENYTENNTTEYMDYVGAMASAQQYGVGWLWWSWMWAGTQGMTTDGTTSTYTEYGKVVAVTDTNSIANTSVKAKVQ
jgi:hypothetical protein